ncbi:MAG: c-type cytochrome [Armatimonadetes bacterium]|nr:c-type cytochrome [Armatimonadota bacterium]
MNFKTLLIFLIVGIAAIGNSQGPTRKDIFGTTSCIGCHGQSAMGGLGPPLAQAKLKLKDFSSIVRTGKGMMPAIKEGELNDADLASIYTEVQAKPWVPDEIPIAYKVGQFLSPKSVSHIFLAAFLFAAIFAIRGLSYWLKCAAVKDLLPAVGQMGWFKAVGTILKSLVVDGICVASLYQADKKRWLLHGLLLYGMCGLILSDVLIAIFNPQRGQLPMTNPLKLLPVLSGLAIALGVVYVMYRYKKDDYIDNGVTLGKDFLFLNLLVHVVVSGFLVVTLKRFGVNDWVMTIYMYHLAAVFFLIVTGPFTRFQHMYVVPALAAVTRLTEAVVASGVDLGFEREPSPGRHHKSTKIAADVLKHLGEEGPIVMRYYP